MLEVKNLTQELNVVKKQYNRKHQNLTGKYAWAKDEYAQEQIQNERIGINAKTITNLYYLKDYIPGMRERLQKRKAKKMLTDQPDKEQQITSAITFLTTKPKPDALAKTINDALGADRLAYVGYILNAIEKDKLAPAGLPGYDADQDIILKERLYFNELSGVSDVEADLEELKTVENIIGNFEEIIAKNFTYMLIPSMLDAEEQKEATEWMKQEKRFNTYDRINFEGAIHREKQKQSA